ncbi:hypothetical protein POM88_031810 [Heracleum sosnowskyi]|uniref:Uncharacterized protein n=1 Tax=Heracleum sosnowskyi TaxID=360622 RepID=A0AAD8MJZ9_9APIA|nr:hypothetical protein POM88_031810 [Heracleum sosnowskyi]
MDAYMFELELAKAKHPDDKNISELQAKVIGILTQLKEKTESSTTSKSKDTFESDHIETYISLEVTVKENNESDKNTTITPMPQQLIREKRETKITAAYRSPYIQREIDKNSKYSTQEYAVWRWIIQKGKDDIEHVFNYGE